jgi:hypothetical protein
MNGQNANQNYRDSISPQLECLSSRQQKPTDDGRMARRVIHCWWECKLI